MEKSKKSKGSKHVGRGKKDNVNKENSVRSQGSSIGHALHESVKHVVNKPGVQNVSARSPKKPNPAEDPSLSSFVIVSNTDINARADSQSAKKKKKAKSQEKQAASKSSVKKSADTQSEIDPIYSEYEYVSGGEDDLEYISRNVDDLDYTSGDEKDYELVN